MLNRHVSIQLLFIFQSKNPNIHRLSNEIEILLKSFAGNLINEEKVEQLYHSGFTSIELIEETNWRDKPLLGFETESQMKVLRQNGTLSSNQVKKFLRLVTNNLLCSESIFYVD